MDEQLFEKLKEFSFWEVRQDLLGYQDKGMWKGGSAPAWVKIIQAAYFGGPTDAIVFKAGWQYVAEAAIEHMNSAPVPSVLTEGQIAELNKPVTESTKKRLPKPNKSELDQMRSDKPGSKMAAVKAYRARTGCSAQEARDILVSATRVV